MKSLKIIKVGDGCQIISTENCEAVLALPRFFGLGDVVSFLIFSLTFGTKKTEDCDRCMRRRHLLNLFFPFVKTTGVEYKVYSALPVGCDFPFLLEDEKVEEATI